MIFTEENEHKKNLSSINWYGGFGPVAGIVTAAVMAPFIITALLLTSHILICAGLAGAGLLAGYTTYKFFNKMNEKVTNAEIKSYKEYKENAKSRAIEQEVVPQKEQPLENWQNKIATSQNQSAELTR